LFLLLFEAAIVAVSASDSLSPLLDAQFSSSTVVARKSYLSYRYLLPDLLCQLLIYDTVMILLKLAWLLKQNIPNKLFKVGTKFLTSLPSSNNLLELL